MHYKDIADVLQLDDGARATIRHEDGIDEVFKHWDKNAAGLPGHEHYPHTWQGLWNVLRDSNLEEIAQQFFDFLNENEP